jgi:hypothetical protein
MTTIAQQTEWRYLSSLSTHRLLSLARAAMLEYAMREGVADEQEEAYIESIKTLLIGIDIWQRPTDRAMNAILNDIGVSAEPKDEPPLYQLGPEARVRDEHGNE